jgi:hypothetical protein
MFPADAAGSAVYAPPKQITAPTRDGQFFAQTIATIKASANVPSLPTWTEKDLYGPDGPKGADIDQGSLGNCYFVASLGAFANQQPELIKRAITYDPATQNFTVTLYTEDRDLLHPFGRVREVQITVTQADINDNIARGGGSLLDQQTDAPLWPAVMEAARAKMLDSNPADGLDEGYHDIEHQGPFGLAGGTVEGAMLTISGSRGDSLQAESSLGSLLDRLPNRLMTILPFGFNAPHSLSGEALYQEIRSALDEGRPVVFGTGLLDDPRGVASRHAYIVEDISKDEFGFIEVTLRNPWASNAVGSLNPDPDNPVVTVKLSDLQPLLTMRGFIIGPAPR